MRLTFSDYLKHCSEDNYNKALQEIKAVRISPRPGPAPHNPSVPMHQVRKPSFLSARTAGAVRPANLSTKKRYDCLMVPASVNGQLFENAILDTGASSSMISQNAIRKLGLWNDIIQEGQQSYKTASGDAVKPWGTLKTADVAIGGLEIPLENVLVSAAQSYDVLVGNDWLQQAEAVISYEKKQISYRIGPDHYGVFNFGPQNTISAHHVKMEDGTFYMDYSPPPSPPPSPPWQSPLETIPEEAGCDDPDADSERVVYSESPTPRIPIPVEPSRPGSRSHEELPEVIDLTGDDYDIYADLPPLPEGDILDPPLEFPIIEYNDPPDFDDEYFDGGYPANDMPNYDDGHDPGMNTEEEEPPATECKHEGYLEYPIKALSCSEVGPNDSLYSNGGMQQLLQEIHHELYHIADVVPPIEIPSDLPAAWPTSYPDFAAPAGTDPSTHMTFGTHLNPGQCEALRKVVWRFADVFSSGDMQHTTDLIEHTINTGDAQPVVSKPYALTHYQQDVAKKEISDMLKLGVITPSCSEWASPIVMVPKPDGSTRFCIDYRKVNAITKKDKFPLPMIDNSLEWMSVHTQYISKIDCKSAFWGIPVRAEDQCKTAFITREGLYEWKVMPFGLTNAPATLQRLMNELLKDLIGNTCCIYLDDCLICSETFEEHLEHVAQVLQRYRAAGLKANPKKTELGKDEVLFLGHILTPQGIRPNPAKTEAIWSFKQPENIHDVRSFLGLANYYRRFVPEMASIVLPIQQLTKKGTPFVWSLACEQASTKIKHLLTSAPLLHRADFAKAFLLQTDWQPHGMGAVLAQETDGVEHPISYASKSLNKAEQLYAPTEGELRAVMWAIRHFRGYLHGHQFVLQTDHKALTYLLTSKNLSTKLLRYALELQEYDFEIRHRPGIKHCNVDALSRLVKDESAPNAPSCPQIYAFTATTRPTATTRKRAFPETCDHDDEGGETALHSVMKHGGGGSRSRSWAVTTQPSRMHRGGTPGATGPAGAIGAAGTTEAAGRTAPTRKRPYKKTQAANRQKAPPISEEEDEESSPEDDSPPPPPRKKRALEQELLEATNTPLPPLPPAPTLIIPGHTTLQLPSRDPPEPSEDSGPPISPDIACELCGIDEEPERMLICDGCLKGYHLDCLEPPVKDIPAGNWFCDLCDNPLNSKNADPGYERLDITLDAPVLHYIETEGHYIDDFTKLEKQRIRRRAGNYLIDDGQLYCKPTARYDHPRLVPNMDQRDDIIAKCHDDFGHFGIGRTISLLQHQFSWTNMTQDVKDYVNNCSVCQVKRVSFLIPDKLHPLPICARFERIHIDLMGPFPASAEGHRYVVVAIDAFTKWAEVAAIPNKEAATVADFFLKDIITRHGLPQVVVCDNGTEFSGEFAELLQKCHIELRHSSPNHPQTNGLVERLNKTLKAALQRSIAGDALITDWDRHLHRVLLGYRASIQASTKYSPFEMLYNRPAILPCHNEYINPPLIDPQVYEHADVISDQLVTHASRYNHIYHKASANLQKAQDKQSLDWHNRHITAHGRGASQSAQPPPSKSQRHSDLQGGDLVLVKNPQKSKKMDPSTIGPFEFIRFSDDNQRTTAVLKTKSGRQWYESIYNISPINPQ